MLRFVDKATLSSGSLVDRLLHVFGALETLYERIERRRLLGGVRISEIIRRVSGSATDDTNNRGDDENDAHHNPVRE
jgi:hypothetical protein